MNELGEVYTTRAADRLALQQAFLGCVDGLRKSAIGPSPDLKDGLDTSGKLSDQLLPFRTTGPELLLDPEAYQDLAIYGQGKAPDRVLFEFQNVLGVGKGDSRRSVSFGTAQLAWFDHHGTKLSFPLAVKVFNTREDESRRMLMHEAALLEHCADVGVKAPKVFGLAQVDSDSAALLTFFEPGLITLDNIQWSMLSKEDQDYHLSTAVEGLALLHEAGIFHGDAEFKNLAFSEQRNTPIAVDLEYANLLSGLPHTPGVVTMIAQRMSKDLRAVKKSMADNRLIAGRDVNKYKQFQERFLQPYYERLTHSQSPLKGALMEAYGRVVEAFAAEAYGEDFAYIIQGVGHFTLR